MSNLGKKLLGRMRKAEAKGRAGVSAEAKKDREVYGLFTLYEPPIGQPCHIDIVAVHGLGGDWERTWTDDTTQKLWLRDFLPKSFPNVRVMSFGYDSAHVMSSSVSDISSAAASLVDSLSGERQNERKRPIIFVAHSLGGIVVKKALILANERSEHWKDILDCALGAIFFAVPHRGADMAYWATFVTNILTLTTLGALGNSSFVKSLKRNSPEFSNISQAFIQPASSFIAIRTFYEMVKIGNQLIVDKDSATLGIQNELAVQIPGADHRNICKFATVDSQKYKIVQNALQQMFAKIDPYDIDFIIKHAEDYHHRCRNEWQEGMRGIQEVEKDYIWILHTTQYHAWISLKGSHILFIEYDYPWDWQAALCGTIEQDLQSKVARKEFIYILNSPKPPEVHAKEEIKCSLPRALIGQLFAKDADCIAKILETQEEIHKRAAGSGHEYILAKENRNRPLLDSFWAPNAAWQSLWGLFACALKDFEQEIVVLLFGCDTETYEVLHEALSYLRAIFYRYLGWTPADGFMERSLPLKILVVGKPVPDYMITKEARYMDVSVRINESSEMKECAASLYFPELHARRDRVEKSETGTNEWIWSHPAYKLWTKHQSSLLWIFGKPGSGKSTLAAKLYRTLCAKENGKGYVTADFFYSARDGVSEEISHTFMLRSVLYQILEQEPSLFPLYRSTFRQLRESSFKDINWPYNALRSILLSFSGGVTDSHRDQKLCHKFLLILDGIDESEDNNRVGEQRLKVLLLFSQLVSTPSGNIFKIIALSRDEGNIGGALRPSCSIDMSRVNKADIKRIVRIGMVRLWRYLAPGDSRLEHIGSVSTDESGDYELDKAADSDDSLVSDAGPDESSEGKLNSISKGTPSHIPAGPSQGIQKLSTQAGNEIALVDILPKKKRVAMKIPELNFLSTHLLENAGGVILWVVMIIRELTKLAKSRACTIGELNSLLSTIPTSLNDLYCEIVRKIKVRPDIDKKQSGYIFAWTLFAGRTMRINEFRDAIAMFHWNQTSAKLPVEFLHENRVGQFAKSWNPTRDLLMSLCGGLVEVVSSDFEHTNMESLQGQSRGSVISPYDHVRLIHRTANDFLLFNPQASFMGLSKSYCVREISIRAIQYLIITFPMNQVSYEGLNCGWQNIFWEEVDYQRFVSLLQDRPLLLYALEHLPDHLEDDTWEQEGREEAKNMLFEYISSLELKRGSLAWLFLQNWVRDIKFLWGQDKTFHEVEDEGDEQIRQSRLFLLECVQYAHELGCFHAVMVLRAAFRMALEHVQ